LVTPSPRSPEEPEANHGLSFLPVPSREFGIDLEEVNTAIHEKGKGSLIKKGRERAAND
jgi:hypothetical protein